jgi:UDP-N-acetylglucosamine acyltransferase
MYRFTTLFKNVKIGKNNYIERNVKIGDNVIIGDNNKIYNGTTIYPNTTIGDNNVILNNNILGEHPVLSSDIFHKKIYNGLTIGNNNFFHINNMIFNGYEKKTMIGNNNKILAECHIGHDAVIHNDVHLYPRCLVGGHAVLLDYSGMGCGAMLHQRITLGDFSFVGMNNAVVKNTFPFFINVNNKSTRLNTIKLQNLELQNFDKYVPILNEILLKYNSQSLRIDHYEGVLPEKIYTIIYNFLSYK